MVYQDVRECEERKTGEGFCASGRSKERMKTGQDRWAELEQLGSLG